MSHKKDDVLPIGFKNGCFTIVGGFDVYQQEVAIIKIAKLEEEKQKFINGESSSWHNFKNIETFDECIAREKDRQLYKVRCKCGKERFESAGFILRKKWRDCGDECGMRFQREAKMVASYPRIKHPSYDIEFTNNIHESLSILGCIDDNFEGEPIVDDKRKKGAGRVYLYKKYRCKCYLCGKEYEFLSKDFEIRIDRYGPKASLGYYCNAFCDCHTISSFQWRTIAILNEYKVPYNVEVSFPDLLSEKGNPLRFDFLIMNLNGTTKCLVECQGEQHFKVGNDFGGYPSLKIRQERDEIKREYARRYNMPLIEIPYTCNTYEKELEYLCENGVIKCTK